MQQVEVDELTISYDVEGEGATTFETEDHQLYYKAVVRFDAQRFATFAPYSRLQAGMTVEADIISEANRC